MRIAMIFFLLGLTQPALALTKCQLNGKVLYKRGSCPKNFSTKYLIKHEYVTEKKLRQHKQKRITQAERSFEDINAPITWPDEEAELAVPEKKQPEPKKMQMSNESVHFQLQKVDENDIKKDSKNARGKNQNLTSRLSEMERKLEQRNKELQLLQQK